MAWFVAALPVIPGMEGRAEKLREGLERHWQVYEQLNRRAGLKRHLEFLQRTPTGATAITIMESDDLSKLSRAFTDTPYDNWWRAYVKDVHGFDPADPHVPNVVQLLDWKAPGVS